MEDDFKIIKGGLKQNLTQNEMTPYETPEDTILRNLAGVGSTIASSAIDFPSNIANLFTSLGEGSENLIHSGLQKIPYLNKIVPEPLQPGPKAPLPSKYIGEKLKPLIGKPEGYFEPQNDWEQLAHDTASTITNLMMPLGGHVRLAKAAGLGTAGNLAKFGAKKIGFGEKTQAGIELGTMIGLSMLGEPAVETKMRELYDKAETILPESGEMVSIKKITPELEKISKKLSWGSKKTVESKNKIKNLISDIDEKNINGQMNIKDVLAFKRDANTILREHPDLEGLNKYVPSITKSMKEVIEEYGKTHPEFKVPFDAAENIFMGLHKASPVNRFLQKHASPEKMGYITAAMLMGGQPIGKTVTHLGQAGLAKGVVRAFEALKNSSEIRKYYGNVISAAAKGNAKALASHIEKLDKTISGTYSDQNKPVGGFEIIKGGLKQEYRTA